MFETSAEVAELFKALLAFKIESEGPKKGAWNPHFKSKYADLEEVVATIDPIAQKHGLSYTQLPCNEGALVGVTTMVFHAPSGQWLRSSFSVPLQRQDAQTAVAAVTYCRRTSLTAAFGLAPEDDDGNTASQKPEPKPDPKKEGEQRPSPTTTPTTKSTASTQPSTSKSEQGSQQSVSDEPVDDEQRNAIKDLFKQLNVSGPGVSTEIKKHTGKAPADIRFADANKLIAELEKQVRLNKARAALGQGATDGKP